MVRHYSIFELAVNYSLKIMALSEQSVDLRPHVTYKSGGLAQLAQKPH